MSLCILFYFRTLFPFLWNHLGVQMPRWRNLKDVSWSSPQRQTSKDSCSSSSLPPPQFLPSSLYQSQTFNSPTPALSFQTDHISSPSVVCPYKPLLLSSFSTHIFSFIYLLWILVPFRQLRAALIASHRGRESVCVWYVSGVSSQLLLLWHNTF